MSQSSSPPHDERSFVPPDFEVPQGLDTPHFHLRPLTPAVEALDYEAVMSSSDLLHAMFGREWPRDGFTREENEQDLVEHQQEFEQRQAFAYTVLSLDETTCLGCVYINPPRGHPVDARVHLWVRQSAYDQGLDPVLFRTVKEWIATRWPFRTVIYPGRNEDGSWEPRVQGNT